MHSCPSLRRASTVSSTARLQTGEALIKLSWDRHQRGQEGVGVGSLTGRIVTKAQFLWYLYFAVWNWSRKVVSVCLPKQHSENGFQVVNRPVDMYPNLLHEDRWDTLTDQRARR